MSSCTGADWSEAFARSQTRSADVRYASKFAREVLDGLLWIGLTITTNRSSVHQTVDEGSTGVLIHPPLAEPRKLCRCPRLGAVRK